MESELALPLRVTVDPVVTLCAVPAFAAGAVFETLAVIVTVAGVLLTLPSLTTRLATYVPAASAAKVGTAEVAPAKAAALPAGLALSVQA